MKYYKFVKPTGHNGLIYKEGINTDILPFNPKGHCQPGGLYYAREDIFAFIEYGEDVYEVTPIGDEIYENPGLPKKWKAHEINLRYIGKRHCVKTFKYMVAEGADPYVYYEYPLRWACLHGHLPLVKYLVDLGADIHINDEGPLLAASQRHLPVVKYLISKGADHRAGQCRALQAAIGYGRLDIVKYLYELGVNPECLKICLMIAIYNMQLPVVKYLVGCGARLGTLGIDWIRGSTSIEIYEYMRGVG